MWKERNTMIKKVYNVKNVERPVMLAISKYCRDKKITQADYLKADKRLKDYLSTE